jgi:hypothetical protein
MARRYARDNRGRFASTGATARGGRLRTAAGKKRATVTQRIAGGKPAGTVGKPKGLKPGAIKVKPPVSSARQAATDRLKVKTQTRRAMRADRGLVITPSQRSKLETGKGAIMKGARTASTVIKPRIKGNIKQQVQSRVERKLAAERAKMNIITRAERVGAAQGNQYNRSLKRLATLKRAQRFLSTGKLPGKDNSIAAQRNMKQAKQRLAAKNKERWAARSAMLTKAAAKNEAKAKSMFDAANTAGNTAFNTQPGRLAGRARMNAQTTRAFELQQKAAQQRSRAANLQRMATTNKGDAAKERMAKADAIKASHKGLKKGDTIEGTLYGKREVVKVNAKSVTVKGGIKDFTIPWEFIKPKA